MNTGILKIEGMDEMSFEGDTTEILIAASYALYDHFNDKCARNCLVDGQFMSLYSYTLNDKLVAELLIK